MLLSYDIGLVANRSAPNSDFQYSGKYKCSASSAAKFEFEY